MRYSIRKSLIAAAAAILVTSSAVEIAAAQGVEEPPLDLVSTLVGDDRFDTLVAAVQAADLVGALSGSDPLTVLAPTDEAFGMLPDGELDRLLLPENKQELTDILLYHVIESAVPAAVVTTLDTADTLLGKPVAIEADETGVRINDANVEETDLAAANGIVHVIDAVLLPPADEPLDLVSTLVGDDRFDTLVAAVQAADLVGALSGSDPLTVLAPTDEAFGMLPDGELDRLLLPENKQELTDILLYHVIEGAVPAAVVTTLDTADTLLGKPVAIEADETGVRINDANVEETDLAAANGIVHVIDAVLLPPADEPLDLVSTLVGDDRFDTLVAAVQAADLVGALSGSDPLTVLAPTDEAFGMLPDGELDRLLLPENKQELTDILLYHVIEGAVPAAVVTTLDTADTLLGKPVAIEADETGVRINDANVVETDLAAANGLVHVIDAVLLPPNQSIVDIADGAGIFSTLLIAAEVAGLADLLADKMATRATVFAPTDEAFENLEDGVLEGLLDDPDLLKEVLLYHIVPGEVRQRDLSTGKVISSQGTALDVFVEGGVFINDAEVTGADNEAANGVVHIIDTVLLPPPNIVELARNTESLSTLSAAITAAGLEETLASLGSFTVFAPTNDAFDKLPDGLLEELLDAPARLRHILLYHVKNGPRLREADLRAGRVLTLQGATFGVDIVESGVAVNQAGVIGTDVEAFNGVVHLIDDVLIPGDGFSDFRASVVVFGGEATVVWPDVLGENLVLESTESLTTPAWQPVVGDVVIADGIQKITVPSDVPFRFFRVRQIDGE